MFVDLYFWSRQSRCGKKMRKLCSVFTHKSIYYLDSPRSSQCGSHWYRHEHRVSVFVRCQSRACYARTVCTMWRRDGHQGSHTAGIHIYRACRLFFSFFAGTIVRVDDDVRGPCRRESSRGWRAPSWRHIYLGTQSHAAAESPCFLICRVTTASLLEKRALPDCSPLLGKPATPGNRQESVNVEKS